MTVFAIIALVAASVRCLLLANFTGEKFIYNPDNATHAFDLIHSFIQSIHIVEYVALLYGIGGFYLYMVVEQNSYYKLNDVFKKSFRCTNTCTCFVIMVLCGLGLIILTVSTFVPVALLTIWQTDIITARVKITAVPHLNLTTMYVGISYISHICHSFTRIFMICVTVVVRSAWLYQMQPKFKTPASSSSLIACARVVLRPKWLEDRIDSDIEDPMDSKEKFLSLIDNYNTTGHFVAPLHGIFQQWFVMQWVVYFIKIIEDFAVVIRSLVTESYKENGKRHELFFVFTHLVFDLLLFLIPYYCASLFNQYHAEYHARLQRVQSSIFRDEEEGWRLQSAQLIPKNPKYVFIPSFCGLSIPLSSPGYNLSIILALFAFIISIITTIH